MMHKHQAVAILVNFILNNAEPPHVAYQAERFNLAYAFREHELTALDAVACLLKLQGEDHVCPTCDNIFDTAEAAAACCVLHACDVCGKEATDCELVTLVSSSRNGPAEGGLACGACREPRPESDAESRGDA